jgi:hypothetical protein
MKGMKIMKFFMVFMIFMVPNSGFTVQGSGFTGVTLKVNCT